MIPVSRFILFIYILIECSVALAQPALNKDFVFGGQEYEELNGLQILADGILIGGSSRSNNDFGTASDTSWNILIAKFDLEGTPIWHKMYGGDRNDRLWSLVATSDGGFIAGGYSFSGPSGTKTSPSRGGMDAWVLKLDASGNIEWEQTYGGTNRDELFSLIEMPDGSGYLLGCHSNSDTSPQKSENCKGGLDFWLIQIDRDGGLLWEKTIGGDAEDQIHDIAFASDGQLLLSGGTVSTRNTGDVGPDFARGAKDYWIVKFDLSTKSLIWNHRFGGPDDDFAYALCVSRYDKIYLGGRSASFGAPPTQYNNGKDAPYRGGASDYWLLELDQEGKKMREWSFGGNGLDDLYTLYENQFGQLVLGGVSDSDISGNKTAPHRGRYDFWMIGLSPEGVEQWQKTIGGSDIDAMTKLGILQNGSLVAGGHSQSPGDFDKTDPSLGVNDFWVAITECDLEVQIDADIAFCIAEPILLVAQPLSPCVDCLYAWSNGANTNTTTADLSSDTITLVIADYRGCLAFDTLIINTPVAPQIDLGPPDTLIESGDILTLGVAIPGLTYLWSDGSTSPTLSVTAPGVYAITVTNPSGCTATDLIVVLLSERKKYYIPNVFSPNLDGVDDFFTAYGDASLLSIEYMMVADRWGEIVFEQKNYPPNQDHLGWDGRFRGRNLENGVFVWLARLRFADGSILKVKGDLTIIR